VTRIAVALMAGGFVAVFTGTGWLLLGHGWASLPAAAVAGVLAGGLGLLIGRRVFWDNGRR
jgi:hypothetical protein